MSRNSPPTIPAFRGKDLIEQAGIPAELVDPDKFYFVYKDEENEELILEEVKPQ